MRFLHFTKTFRMMISVNCGFVYVYVKYVERALKEAIQRNTLQTLQINQNTKSKIKKDKIHVTNRNKAKRKEEQRNRKQKGKLMP